MKYLITVKETLKRTVTIEADSETEAEEIAQDKWMDADIVLDADDFTGVEFIVEKKPD